MKGWYILAVCFAFYAGIIIGANLMQMREPTYYSEGYCVALGGVRLTDEACNVSGQIVEVK